MVSGHWACLLYKSEDNVLVSRYYAQKVVQLDSSPPHGNMQGGQGPSVGKFSGNAEVFNSTCKSLPVPSESQTLSCRTELRVTFASAAALLQWEGCEVGRLLFGSIPRLHNCTLGAIKTSCRIRLKTQHEFQFTLTRVVTPPTLSIALNIMIGKVFTLVALVAAIGAVQAMPAPAPFPAEGESSSERPSVTTSANIAK